MNARFYSAPDSAAGIREERQRERRQKGEFREMQKEREKGEEKAKEERRLRRDEQRERMGKGRGEGEKGETRKNRGIPSVLILQFKHCLKDTFRCRYWLCFFLKSPPVAVNVTDL